LLWKRPLFFFNISVYGAVALCQLKQDRLGFDQSENGYLFLMTSSGINRNQTVALSIQNK
jgi:hypothetical protein